MKLSYSSIFDFFDKYQKFIDRPWYLWFVSFLAMIDVFVWIIPTDLLLISFVLVRPKKWVAAFIWVSLGSAIGAFLIGFMFHYFSDFAFTHFAFLEGWQRTSDWIHRYGAPAVGLCTAGPAPIVICAGTAGIMKMNLTLLFVSSLLGRLAKYSLFCFLASYSPHLFQRTKARLSKKEHTSI